VHDGVLFIFNFADKVQALNATNGDLIWEYKRDLPEKLLADFPNVLAKRNMAIYDDKLIVATSDAHIVAIDAKTGKVAWDHTTADWTKGWRYTGGPFIVNGKVIPGHDRLRQRGAWRLLHHRHDIKTGAELWRVNTIAHPGDPNYDTWNGLPLESRSAPRRGFPAPTIPTRTWCSTAPASPIRGLPKCAARCRRSRA